MRSLGIELTHERIIIRKLEFNARIQNNPFTKELYEELEKLNVNNSFSSDINKLLEDINEKYYDNLDFSIPVKINVMKGSIEAYGVAWAKEIKTVDALKKIYKLKKKQIKFDLCKEIKTKTVISFLLVYSNEKSFFI